MKRYIKMSVAGILYGLLPVLLSALLIYSLGTIAELVGNLVGLEQGVVLQVSQALQQLQEGKLVFPWLAGAVLAVLSVGGLLLTQGHRRCRLALLVVGVVLLLPLTLGAFCLVQVNDVQVWPVIAAVAKLVKAL